MQTPLHFLPLSQKLTRRSALGGLALAGFSGCVNSLTMFSKTLMGDPSTKSRFEAATGVDLVKDEKRIILHVIAPATTTEEFDSLSYDLEDELFRRFKLKKLLFVDSDKVSEVLDQQGGRFNPELLATKFSEADYAFQIRIENCSIRDPGSPNLFRGRCRGSISGYAFESDPGETVRRSGQVFEQTFSLEYPKTYPVPSEQTPLGIFKGRFLDSLTDLVGNMFYDVNTSSMF